MISRLKDIHQRLRRTLIRVGLRHVLVAYRNREVRAQDVMLASYPKSGNTWLRALIASAVVSNVSSFEDLSYCVPELELLSRKDAYKLDNGGRVIKTHEKWSPRYRSAIYLVRDVRNVAVSYFFHLKRVSQFNGNFDAFIKAFADGRLDGYGAWSGHVDSWSASSLAYNKRLMVVRYEDLLRSPVQTLGQVMNFLGIQANLYTLILSVESNSIHNMRKMEMRSNIDHHDGIHFVRATNNTDWSTVIDSSHERLLKSKMGRQMDQFGYL